MASRCVAPHPVGQWSGSAPVMVAHANRSAAQLHARAAKRRRGTIFGRAERLRQGAASAFGAMTAVVEDAEGAAGADPNQQRRPSNMRKRGSTAARAADSPRGVGQLRGCVELRAPPLPKHYSSIATLPEGSTCTRPSASIWMTCGYSSCSSSWICSSRVSTSQPSSIASARWAMMGPLS